MRSLDTFTSASAIFCSSNISVASPVTQIQQCQVFSVKFNSTSISFIIRAISSKIKPTKIFKVKEHQHFDSIHILLSIYFLVLAVRRHRLHYLGHVLRMPSDRMVWCALMALVIDASHYPSGSLFSDCQGIALPQLVAMASSRSMWRAKVTSLSWTELRF